MEKISLSKNIADYTRREYIEPARLRGEASVRVVAGDVQKGVRLNNRAALVCQALKSRKFLRENHLELERWDGPPSGLSTTVAFTYRLVGSPAEAANRTDQDPLMRLWGAGKEVFEKLGGGEEFIRQERDAFESE